MEKFILSISFFLNFLLLFSFPVKSVTAFSGNLNFSISTSNLYFPGEEIKLNLNSYDYLKDNKSNEKIEFLFEIYQITDISAFYSKQLSRYSIDVLGADSLNLLQYAKEIYSFKKFIKQSNEGSYYYLNESFLLNIKSKGAYIVKATAGNKVAYCGFVVTNLGIISKAGNNSMLAYVIDRKSGNPVSGAELKFYIGQKQIGSGMTNDGLFYQSVINDIKSVEEKNSFPLIIGELNDDIVISDQYLFFGYGENRYSIFTFTEQPVYRTGSVVNFKSIIRENKINGYLPFNFKEVTVKIRDSKGAEVYKEILTTNETGSIAGVYKIDNDAAIGDYFITVSVDEKSKYENSFTVEQYKKPEYKVIITTDRQQYYGKDNLKAEVKADYFFGSPVTNADVEYNVYKVRYYRPWWLYSEYSWWYEDFYKESESNFSGAEFIYSGKGILNSEGKFEFDYQLNEEFKEDYNIDYYYRPYHMNSDYKYILQAKVTDNSRREISGTATVLVTRGGFTLSAKSDKYLYKPDESINLEVFAMDFSNKPVSTDFEVSIYKTTWNRSDYKEQKDFITTLKGNTLSDGKGIVSFNKSGNLEEGYYSAEVKAKDEKSNEITCNTSFFVTAGEVPWYYDQSGAVQIITDKESYKQGEVCKALIIITTPGVNALITANTDDIVFFKSEKFNGSSMTVDIPVTEQFLTNFDINVNYVKDGIYYSGEKKVMIIPDQKFLTVLIEPSQLIYKPKESGELKVRVTDNYGNPVRNAEVSIGIVDESIYSIKEDNTRDIRKFFYGNKNFSVSTAFNNIYTSNGQSRLITIFERFNLKSTSESNLATVSGSLLRKNGTPIANALIVIDKDYYAATTDDEGNFEFMLPEGKYTVSAYYNNIEKDDLKEIILIKGQVKRITLYNDKELNYDESTSDFQNGRGDIMEERMVSAPGAIETTEYKTKKSDKDMSSDESGKSLVQPDVRSDFRDAILWSPYSVTDNEGYASVTVNYPDNLTTWRITSRVITEDTKVGEAVSTVITRKDLLVRVETPRFFQKGDIVTVSAIVHNYLDESKDVRINFRCDNLTLMESIGEKNVVISSNSELRTNWTVRADVPSGDAVIYTEALTNEESDAVELKIPLQPRGLKVDVNTVADIADEFRTESKYIIIPDNADLKSTLLKFTAEPSIASTILTALDELAGYPYGCVEQTMSRFLPSIVVANAFKNLNAPISEATKNELPKMIDKGLKRLYGFQHSDGGWGWWENDQTNPFMTAYVIYGLSIAGQSGFEIKQSSFNKGLASLKNQLNGQDIDATTRAYMLYSLAVANQKDEELFRKNIDKILSSEVNSYTRSLLALTWKLIGKEENAKAELKKLEKDALMSGEGAAYWEGKEFHYRWQDDKVQTTAMALKAIISIDENSSLKEKVVRWLMSQRMGLYWRNTQETAIVIYSIVDYLKHSGELDPDYSLKIYLNGQSILEKRMTRDDVFSKPEVMYADKSLMVQGQNEIKIEKSGKGKLYYSSYTTYYSDAENIQPKENGFRVEREYFRLEKYTAYGEEKITYRKKYFDGNVKSGDEILVKLRVYTRDENNQYFMLEDELPSGIEVVKDDWAFTIEDEDNYAGYPYYYWRWWYADKEIRDDKVVFFATHLGKGEYEFSYIIQAQIPGEYTVNPAKGMLMYYPEYNGSTGKIKLNITE